MPRPTTARSSFLLAAVAVAGIAAAARSNAGETERTADVVLAAPERLDPGQSVAAQLTITNGYDAPASWKATYSLQADGAMFSGEPPDPVFGSDRALGTRSWTEADGKIVEEGSLTDGKDYTDAGTPWIRDHFTEAFQYVDLGRARKIIRLSYLSGDANHA